MGRGPVHRARPWAPTAAARPRARSRSWPTSGSPRRRWACRSGPRWRRSSWPSSRAGRRSTSTGTRPRRTGSWRSTGSRPTPTSAGRSRAAYAKIVAIGLGKRAGAEAIHSFGPARLGHWVPRAAAVIAASGHLLGGLGIVEDGHDRAARIAFLEASEIGGPAEAALLGRGEAAGAVASVRCRGRPRRRCHGQGQVGLRDGHQRDRPDDDPRHPEFARPRIVNIVVLDLTDGLPRQRGGFRTGRLRPGPAPRESGPRLDLHQLVHLGPRRRPARPDPSHPADRSRRDRGGGGELRGSGSRHESGLPGSATRWTLASCGSRRRCLTTWPSDPRIEVLGPPEPLRFEDGRLLG